MLRTAFLIATLSLVLSGCQTLVNVPVDATDGIAKARVALQAKDYDTTVATLDVHGVASLTLPQKVEWHVLRSTALADSGEPWAAFQSYEFFIRDLSLPTPALADLTYRIGETLASSDAAFWPFYSAREQAKRVLRAFVTYFFNRPQMPDALHRLAELAYEDGNYDLARKRYTELVTGRFDRSVWNTKAVFRVAMSYFHQIEGPAYDIDGMNRAMAELTDFLDNDKKLENPRFRKEALAALGTVRSWLAQKHVRIADFYKTLENTRGERHHLLVAVQEFPETAAAERAGARLEKLAQAEQTARKAAETPTVEGPPKAK